MPILLRQKEDTDEALDRFGGVKNRIVEEASI